jgi:hypothetical protein
VTTVLELFQTNAVAFCALRPAQFSGETTNMDFATTLKLGIGAARRFSGASIGIEAIAATAGSRMKRRENIGVNLKEYANLLKFEGKFGSQPKDFATLPYYPGCEH